MPPQSLRWKSDRAVLFVHGVGNARPGDYNSLVSELQEILGDAANDIAFYFLYYDQINDWFARKTQAGLQVARLVTAIRSQLADKAPTLGNAIADFAGDVLWPVLLADAREAVRSAYLSQLQQIVLDGTATGRRPQELRITIIAHSLGCFHTYEAVYEAATNRRQVLSPATGGVQIERVVYMASPVQLIRTVAGLIDFAVPQRETLHCLRAGGLATPVETDVEGIAHKAVRNTVSITGNLDPVGGWFFRSRGDWAYMNLPDQESFIDQQQVADVDLPEEDSFIGILEASIRGREPPRITPLNPHDWSAYVQRHGERLRGWLA